MRFSQKNKMALTALAFALQVSSLSASELACRFQDSLTTVLSETMYFLNYLETDTGRQTARALETRLNSRSIAELSTEFKLHKSDRLAKQTIKLIEQQRMLLAKLKKSGPFIAANAARAMQARQQLRVVSSEFAALSCTSSSGQSSEPGGGTSSSNSLMDNSAVKMVGSMFLLGVIVAGLFGWYTQLSKRRTKRFTCNFQSVVVRGGDMYPAVITNISRSGAKLDVEEPFEQGEKMDLIISKRKISGRVIRHKNGQMAIDFSVLLHSDIMDAVLGEPVSTPEGEADIQSA